MPTPLPWRPISEASPDLEEALVFDPTHVSLDVPSPGRERRVVDERVKWAFRSHEGRWCVECPSGGYPIDPTHFIDPCVPDGYPAQVDPAPPIAEQEAREAAAAAAAAARVAAPPVPYEETEEGRRERALERTYEAYWAEQVKAAHRS